MFTTVESVKELTGYDLPLESIKRAQALIESYTGRLEIQVTDAVDLAILDRATAYQAVYMEYDLVRVFGQAKAEQVMAYGNMVTYVDDGVSPWIAPLAVIACRRLSWNRTRSVKTGSIYNQPLQPKEWKTE